MSEASSQTALLSAQDNAFSKILKQKNRLERIAVGILLISFISYVIADSLTTQYIKTNVIIFLEWVEGHSVAGVFAFMGVYIIATILFIPGSVLTLGIGFVFANAFGLGKGVLLATAAVFVGATIGAICAFLLGRYLLRDLVEKLTAKYPIFEALDAVMQHKGFRIMILLRLSPLIPFNAINYIAGITGMSLSHYIYSTFAILPGTVLFIFIGASAGSLADSETSGQDNRTVRIVTIVTGIVFGVLGVGVASYYAKKELNQTIEKAEREREDNSSLPNDDGDVIVEELPEEDIENVLT